jgi:hypothetical protein
VSVVFLGQFLLERGEIDSQGLSLALELMEHENPTLGELAAEMGFASEAECRRVFGEQRRRDRPFGELALQMGVLNSVELDEVLEQQQQRRIGLGEALVRLSLQPVDRVRQLLDESRRCGGATPGARSFPPAFEVTGLPSCWFQCSSARRAGSRGWSSRWAVASASTPRRKAFWWRACGSPARMRFR